MRIKSLDIMKTIGIIAFIIWHCYENFYGPTCHHSPFMRVTFFATGLFIFLSGANVGIHYNDKLRADRSGALRKISIRSSKLLIIVFLANIVVAIIAKKQFSSLLALFLDVATRLLSLLYLDRWDISLQVLLVIASGIMLNSLIISFCWHHSDRCGISYLKCIIFFVPLVLLFLFDVLNGGHLPYFWRYLPLSYLGAVAGVVVHEMIRTNLLSTCSKRTLLSIILFACILAGTFMVASFLSLKIAETILYETIPYHIMVLSIFVGLGGIAYLLLDNGLSYSLHKYFYLMGEYSLFVYLLQIIIINLLSMFVRGESSNLVAISLSIFITVICLCSTIALDRLVGYQKINKIYRLIFC